MKMADSARDVEDAVPYEINLVHNKRRLRRAAYFVRRFGKKAGRRGRRPLRPSAQETAPLIHR